MVWVWIILGTAAVLIVLDSLARIPSIKPVGEIFEKVPPFKVTPQPPNPRGFAVSFPGDDGSTIQGSLYLPERRATRGIVIFCPELNGNHWMAMNYAEALVHAGFAVLSFDFRGQGESDAIPGYAPLHWATEFEVADVNAAIGFIKSRGDLAGLSIGIFGISRGGGVALAAASLDERIQAVVVDSAFSPHSLTTLYVRRWGEIYLPRWYVRNVPYWHLKSIVGTAIWLSGKRRKCQYVDLEKILPKLAGRQTLFISGKRDSYIKPEVASLLASKVGASSEVWIVKKAKHNMAREQAPHEYDSRLISVFENSLLPPAAQNLQTRRSA